MGSVPWPFANALRILVIGAKNVAAVFFMPTESVRKRPMGGEVQKITWKHYMLSKPGGGGVEKKRKGSVCPENQEKQGRRRESKGLFYLRKPSKSSSVSGGKGGWALVHVKLPLSKAPQALSYSFLQFSVLLFGCSLMSLNEGFGFPYCLGAGIDFATNLVYINIVDGRQGVIKRCGSAGLHRRVIY